MKQIIETTAAPKAIGPYSQAVRCGECVYISGQIPLDINTMTLVSSDFKAQATQVFKHLEAIANACGRRLDDCVKLTIYLIDLEQFAVVNEVMQTFFSTPYPARATVQVSALPKSAQIEVDAILKA